MFFMDLGELSKRVDEVSDDIHENNRKLYDLQTSILKRDTENKSDLLLQDNKIAVLDHKVSTLEAEFKSQEGRLWALIMVVVSEIIVAVIRMIGHGGFF